MAAQPQLTNMGIKPGSRNLVWAFNEDQAEVIPSCVAEIQDAKMNIIGYEVGKPRTISSVYPLHRGIITDQEVHLLKQLLGIIKARPNMDIVIASPETELKEGRHLLEDAISEVFQPKNKASFPESFCTAVAHLGVEAAVNSFVSVLNLGSTTTGFGVFSKSETLVLESYVEQSGTIVDDKILQKLKNIYGKPSIDLVLIEELKRKFSFEEHVPMNIEVLSKAGLTQVDAHNEFSECLNNYVKGTCALFFDVINRLESTDTHHVITNKILIGGGMSNIPGIDKAIQTQLEDMLDIKLNIEKIERGEVMPAIGAYSLSKVVF
jgi:actin-related protein